MGGVDRRVVWATVLNARTEYGGLDELAQPSIAWGLQCEGILDEGEYHEDISTATNEKEEELEEKKAVVVNVQYCR